MTPEKEKTMIDYLKKVSPGSALRTVIDDLVRSGLGALIIFDAPELHNQSVIEGGFRINCRFTPQKLFELCKMDGAIIVSSDLKRILFANVLINPDVSIHTTETGTRHKAAERSAKQASTFAIAVSERRKKTTLYHNQSRYFLKSSDELLRNLSSTLQVLEKHREAFDQILGDLNVLEMSELVSVSDACQVIQRAEMILKISESVKRDFTELGKEGNIMRTRYRELIRNVEKRESEILRDYSNLTLKRTKTLLSNLSYDGILDLESLARLIMEKTPEENISPRGYRFLSHLTLSDKEISLIVNEFGSIAQVLGSESADLEPILKNRAASIREEITHLREQILNGKVVC